jgi:hypothetical protein
MYASIHIGIIEHKCMTINNNTVLGWAYATRSDLRKIDPPVVAATIERFFAEPSVAPASVIPSHIQVRQIIFEPVKQGPCQMPVTIRPRHLHVGRYRRCL